ncbi:MAG: hypothetical protein L0227_03795 [Chloroflexi bacterium]|nr:hypothetical protein [Chloroflexota bacterium]
MRLLERLPESDKALVATERCRQVLCWLLMSVVSVGLPKRKSCPAVEL